MGFFEKLRGAVDRNNSLVCVGLDPRPEILPNGDILAFNRWIVDRTADLVCAYKPNFAFYEALGLQGLEALRRTVSDIHERTDVPVILDAKRGDIGSTAEAYARGAFEIWGADAVTLNPYLGYDGLLPFVQYAERGAFVLCHTSNPSAEEFQALTTGGRPLYEVVAQRATAWDTLGNLGLVIGATYPEELVAVRGIAPEMWLLVPGIGAQGGDLEATLRAGLRADGMGLVISASRSIICTDDPRQAALSLRNKVNQFRLQTSGHGTRSAAPSQRLALVLHDLGCVQLDQFTLASGKTSPIYIDLRLLVSESSALRTVARAYARLLHDLHFDRLAAIPYAGLPIGTAVALETGQPLIYPRREVKEHGARRSIEGRFAPGEEVVVLDDVISSGGSKLSAIETLETAGLTVRHVVVLIDREQGGKELLASRGYQLHSVLTLGELLDVCWRGGLITREQMLQCQNSLRTQ